MMSGAGKILGIFWIAIIVGVTLAADAEEGKIRIVNGVATTIDKAPYIVELRRKHNEWVFEFHGHECGGTLVTSRFVVTAAHCFDGKTKDDYVIVGNISSLSELGERRLIENVFIHPEYNKSVLMNKDVAVVKLDRDMVATFSNPIKLCDHHLQANDFIRIFGWGYIEEYGDPSEDLRTARVKILAQDQCEKRYVDVENTHITDAMVCAIGDKGEDACTTDSGGPGIYKQALCAVIVGGVGCGLSEYGGIYVRIDQVRDFIEDSLKK